MPADAGDAPGMLGGRRVLVTGGSRGLGRALVLRACAEGARVAFTYSKDAGAAEATRAEAVAMRAGPDADVRAFQVSVLDVAATESLVDQLDRDWGGLDALVNNAGISQALPLALIDEEDWDTVMDVNAKGTYLTSRAVLPLMMRQRSGVILNLGSLAGERALEAPVHYAASKAAVSGLTRAMAKAVGRHQIRVVCLAPGLLEDGVGKNVPDHKLADYLRHCALGRIGTFEEVACFAVFLLSDRVVYLSGETIVLDGGVS